MCVCINVLLLMCIIVCDIINIINIINDND